VVYAHAQALAQCHEWLNQHLPETVERIAVSSNGEAARLAAQDRTAAAIAGQVAAEIYHLHKLAINIEDEPNNTTRFLVLGHQKTVPTGRDKTSLVFSTPNKAGAVNALLAPFSAAGISMTKFESRPSRTGLWEYVFFVDIEGHCEDLAVRTVLNEFAEHNVFVKVIGAYPQAVI
ncbi:prephenate dehydratase domain-containing protein, partial [Neisseria sp.]|uniref:prephenate dehydratase n=1 Tax=Neisseria sp. TaxID=192066 RepID=UPI00289E935E